MIDVNDEVASLRAQLVPPLRSWREADARLTQSRDLQSWNDAEAERTKASFHLVTAVDLFLRRTGGL
jgi:hypothetical protein